MKRRNFLLTTAGAAGALIPWLSQAAQPCPPPLLSLSGGTSAKSPCPTSPVAGSFTTNFPGTEDPISEGGKWNRLGTSWTNVRTTPGLAFGTNGAADAYDDSYAYLSGFSADQTAQATIYLASGISTSETHEVEVLLRWADSAQTARGYECNLNFLGGVQVVRWEGGPGDFTVLGGGGVGNVQTGDVLKATFTGNTIQVYYNDSPVCSVTDSKWTSGNPGIGFFKRPPGLNNVFGFSSFTASSL
jgi:hypothetical protein